MSSHASTIIRAAERRASCAPALAAMMCAKVSLHQPHSVAVPAEDPEPVVIDLVHHGQDGPLGISAAPLRVTRGQVVDHIFHPASRQLSSRASCGTCHLAARQINPQPVSESVLEDLVETAIEQSKAKSPGDVDAVMKLLRGWTLGRADQKKLRARVLRALEKAERDGGR